MIKTQLMKMSLLNNMRFMLSNEFLKTFVISGENVYIFSCCKVMCFLPFADFCLHNFWLLWLHFENKSYSTAQFLTVSLSLAVMINQLHV